jgi:hypothetical protein
MTGPDGFSWTENLALAEAEVSRLLSQLPAPLRERARTIPVCFAERPTRAQQADGWALQLLHRQWGIASRGFTERAIGDSRSLALDYSIKTS